MNRYLKKRKIITEIDLINNLPKYRIIDIIPNIISYIPIITDNNIHFIVKAYLQGGNLQKQIISKYDILMNGMFRRLQI